MVGRTTDIQLQYFVTTPQYYPQLTTALTHLMNAGFKQKLLKGALTVSLLVTDVFDTYKWQVYSSNSLFDLQNNSTRKSRMLWVGLTYNFNSFKQKAVQKKQEDAAALSGCRYNTSLTVISSSSNFAFAPRCPCSSAFRYHIIA